MQMHCFKFHNKMRAVLPRERRKAVLKTFTKSVFEHGFGGKTRKRLAQPKQQRKMNINHKFSRIVCRNQIIDRRKKQNYNDYIKRNRRRF